MNPDPKHLVHQERQRSSGVQTRSVTSTTPFAGTVPNASAVRHGHHALKTSVVVESLKQKMLSRHRSILNLPPRLEY